MTLSMPALLGTAKTFRGKVSMATIIIAFVLSIMVIDTNRQCKPAPAGYDDKTKLAKTISIIVLVLCCLLFLWDIAVMAEIV